MGPRPLGPIGPMVQGPWAHRAHAQACSCLARAGPGPTQLHGCVWALWAPGALDHEPYGPQGPWAQPHFEPVAELFRFFSRFWASQK